MRAVVFHRHGSTEELRVEEFPEPEPRPGDAVLEVGATSINGFDPMILGGTTGLRTPLPMVPCGDIAGRIVGTFSRGKGEGSPAPKLGDFGISFGTCGRTAATREGGKHQVRATAATRTA